jgi:hypothetical protein
MQAVVFGKYPTRYVETKIVPQLERLGIEIRGFETKPANFAKANLSDIDVVFFLSELASHKEQDQIKKSITRHGAKLVYLSRKTSQWPEQFQRAGLVLPEKKDMPRPPSVKDLDGFFRKYIELKDRGFTLDDMVPTLRDFWPDLKDGKHISAYISRLRNQSPERLPQFFKNYDSGNTHAHIPQPPQEPVRQTGNEGSPAAASSVPEPAKDDDADLLQLAEQEIAELRAQLEASKAAIEELKKRSQLKQNVSLIRQGVKTGLFTVEEGFAKLEQLVG